MGSERLQVCRLRGESAIVSSQSVLQRVLPEAAARARLEWLHQQNPDGEGFLWILRDEKGEDVGTSAAYPRRMRIEGREVLALNLSDFGIDAAYRSLGPAMKLLRATLAPVREGEFAFCYDFPSRAMRAIYQRMGGLDLGPTERWRRLLRLDGVAARRLGGAVGRVAGAAGTAALRARDALASSARGFEVSRLEGEPGEEFDALDAHLGGLAPVVGVRDARYVAWRYGRHAMWPHEIWCARRGGELFGFAATRESDSGAWDVVDLVTRPDQDAAGALIEALVAEGRRRGLEALDTEVLASSPAAQRLASLRFTRRESGPGPVPVTAPDLANASMLSQGGSWWLTGGDRDV